MKIYFTASARGIQKYKEQYEKISNVIEELGHEHLDTTVLNINRQSLYKDENIQREDLYKQSLQNIKKADVVVLEITMHSLSMGYVMHSALELGKPVIALFLSSNDPYYASGISDTKLQLIEYSQKDDLKKILSSAIKFASDQQDVRFNFFIPPRIVNYLDWVAKERKIPRSVYLRELIEQDMEKNEEYKS